MFGMKILRDVFSDAVALDLGTVNTLAAIKGRGIVLREPSAVAVSTGEDREIVEIGSGEVTKVDTTLINTLLENDFVPVIFPIGLGEEDCKSYNVNADDAACAIATAMKAGKLVFLSDIEGVYEDPHDPSTLISELTVEP